jgi:Ferritin-like domain
VVDRRAVLAGGGALLLAGCEKNSLRARIKRGAVVSTGDVQVLNRLLALEYYAIAAYTAGLPLLGRSAAKVAKQFLGQEAAHASTLAGLVKQAGGVAVMPAPRYALGQPVPGAIVSLLHRLENAQVVAYVELIPQLSPGRLRSTAAAIMANDAQHVAVLRAELGRPPVPAAFAGGSE